MAEREAEPIRGDYRLLLARLGEVWLKGRNRNEFLRRLERNLRTSLTAAIPGVRVRPTHGRFLVDLPEGAPLHTALAICEDTPGLSGVSPAVRVESDLAAIERAAVRLVEEEWAGATGTFAVDAKRTDKRFPLTSPQLNQQVGAVVQPRCGLQVNLSAPDRVLGIEVNPEHTHLWVHARRGAGGLPIGTAGKVMLLLSGGIDSPVAGYLAQNRGCELEAVYFHSPPFISEASRDKVEALARRLAPRQGGLALHVVPFTDIQKAIKADVVDARLTVLLYRRFMYRIAAQLARQRKAIALCTGENLGQVASQTLENLTVVDRLTDLLTLRPLIAHDKLAIMAIARRIGTYDTSILPYDDCCTLFVPRNPAIRGSVEALERAEAALDVDALVADALARAERVDR